MLARRAFLGFLGFAAGAAAAVHLKIAHKVAAPKVPPIFQDGDVIYQGVIIRQEDRYGFVDDMMKTQRELNLHRSAQLRFIDAQRHWTAVERERVRFHRFMTGQQWTPEQIKQMEARRV